MNSAETSFSYNNLEKSLVAICAPKLHHTGQIVERFLHKRREPQVQKDKVGHRVTQFIYANRLLEKSPRKSC